MFEKIRNRLLIANLLVFSLVLGGFAGVVRLVFVHNLKQQLTEQLTTLGQSAVGNTELENGRLQIEEEYIAQDLFRKSQALEWFDPQGNRIKQQGQSFPNTPLNPQETLERQGQNSAMQSVTLPVLSLKTGEIIGYVRASQRLDELDKTVLQLDIGLGIGVIVATILSGIGSLWLNRQAMQPIEASFQRLKQFTADASHELRNPLMAISSNVEVALRYPKGMRTEDLEVLSAVANAAEQMTQLTEDLLLLARTERISTLTLAPVNLSDLLQNLIQLYSPQANAKLITLKLTAADNLSLQGDYASLTKALTNLLQNAIRYTPAEGTIWVEARHSGHQIQVMVRDTGIGIAPEHLEQIFEQFWRADQARSHDQGGSGLGLSISRAIVQAHGGILTVTSQLGQGSCFMINLPLNPPH